MAQFEDPTLGPGTALEHALPAGVSDARAIERVLEAERDAERAVSEAGQRAEQMLAAAREHARQIGERADERVLRIHTRSGVLADAAIEALGSEYQDRERESQRTLSDEKLLADAVERVLVWLLDEEVKP